MSGVFLEQFSPEQNCTVVLLEKLSWSNFANHFTILSTRFVHRELRWWIKPKNFAQLSLLCRTQDCTLDPCRCNATLLEMTRGIMMIGQGQRNYYSSSTLWLRLEFYNVEKLQLLWGDLADFPHFKKLFRTVSTVVTPGKGVRL